MAAHIIVSGLPADVPFRKLMYTFKWIFKKVQIKQFWIRDMTMCDADEKQMTIEFDAGSDARKARNLLDNYPFPHPVTKQEFTLFARINDSSTEPAEYHEDRRWESDRRPRHTKRRQQDRQRSPSPGYRSEASKLDLEIELLRKQRQVIEEERRLLLERKKLDMIREYGPSASRDFMDYEDEGPPRKRRQPPAPVEVKKPRQRSPPPPKPNAPRNKDSLCYLPAFFQPCKKLISDMKEFIKQDSTPEEEDILVKLIRAAIRKNLAIALEGREYMPTAGIMKLYREQHPKSEDEAFVRKILANIRASYLPDELECKLARVKKEPKETASETGENKSDDKADDNRGKLEANKTESRDKPANGGNETDAATDFTVDVKAEPNSQKPNDTLEAASEADLAEAETTTTGKPEAVEESTDPKDAAVSEKPVEESTEAETAATTGETKTVEESPEVLDEVTADDPTDEKAESDAAETAVKS